MGMRGTVSRLVEEGAEVHYLAFTDCSDELPKGAPPDTLVRECFAATERLGVPKPNVEVMEFSNKHFSESLQRILEEIEARRKRVHPDLVLVPCPGDPH